jgi:crossover junction endodeoxyribonuclease RusA
MLPFEFVVDGPPVSQQANDPTRLPPWRAQVRAAAAERWPIADEPIAESIQILVTYFHEGEAIRLDNDNMVKPIQDALAGLIYIDDRQITDTKVRKTSLDGSFRVRGMSPVLAEAFLRNREFLYIRITSPPDHSEFLS